MTAEEYYQQGNAWRKQGDFKHALDCYMEAIALDPESPAVAAKEMLDNIMSFYCKDYYNPSRPPFRASCIQIPLGTR